MAVPVRLIPSPPTVCLSTPLLSLPPIARKPSPSSSCSGSSRARPGFRCSAANKPSPPPPEVSSNSSSNSMAKIRSEVLSPFRSVRMFFYLAFMASAGLGSLIALTQLVPALTNPARLAGAAETLRGLGIDVAAVAVFAFLYSRDRKASDAQVARLTREENLSRLKLRVGAGGRVVPLGELRGSARLVIVAGPAEFVEESFRRSKPFLKDLMDRGVLVLPFPTDGNTPALQFDGEAEEGENEGDGIGEKSKRLWQLTPVYTSEWAKWLEEQKKLANVAPDSPVYLSLRMDGRVRGSGVGYPPWQAFVAQLPLVKGMWSGFLDGMDGRV
ncbi:protein LOW PSII ACCUMULATION 1, chloroplastic isoform X2 [Brachypodium distachyon]|uniref:protein LOW PSII ACCUMULATION 1, chloroplastic isoform X2 n=1 Tax=Brachypodium distachyon TaxID=15368 RepID=UPI00052FF49A|nr:protein LOW PSII ACCUMULATION 1, chloroplastic isoform X2 [Brachypodium distachyon]|eukprot:XP_010240110.1 protein LOW PSII ACCUMULATION 1, chloroplastic isoform X2 [Brachypodium distachyon]